MVRNVCNVFVIYAVLTTVTTAVMQDFSLRHTLFLLIDAILLTAGTKLVKEPRAYYKALGVTLAMLCSVFVIRFLTPTVIKVWDIDIYLSFCLAVANVIIMLAALLPVGLLKKGAVSVGGLAVFIPILICWGYYATEHSWLNVDAMMAILQTNPSETLEYLTDRAGISACLVAVVSVLMLAIWGGFLCKVKVRQGSWSISAGILVFFVLNAVLLIRTSDNFVTSIYRETRDYQKNYEEYARQIETRKQNLANSKLQGNTGKPGIYVLVIGESQNPTRMSAYGYKLKTTPWLESMASDPDMLLFRHAYACQVQTVPALTYALTAKNQYNSLKLENAVSLIDVAKAAGFQTVWLSNQVRFGGWGTPVTVIAEEADQKIWINSHQGNTLDTEYYDGELVNRLQNIALSEKTLIVVHLMGNHISYHSRYPADFDRFKAEGKRSEYDNSILYNDHVMKMLCETVKAWPDFKGLLYFSDHGEAINYGKSHNPDTFIFDMAYIPMYMYFSPSYQRENLETVRTLRAAQNSYFTNDLIFNTMLGIMGIRNENFYEAENDLTSPGYDCDINRFKTLYGKKNISEDIGKR